MTQDFIDACDNSFLVKDVFDFENVLLQNYVQYLPFIATPYDIQSWVMNNEENIDKNTKIGAMKFLSSLTEHLFLEENTLKSQILISLISVVVYFEVIGKPDTITNIIMPLLLAQDELYKKFNLEFKIIRNSLFKRIKSNGDAKIKSYIERIEAMELENNFNRLNSCQVLGFNSETSADVSKNTISTS